MARIFTEADFNGGMYTQYEEYPFFSERAEKFLSKISPGYVVCVAGCGFGYLVDHLVQRGIAAYGFDASSYAIAQGQALLPGIADRLAVANATNRQSLSAMRSGFGFANNFRFNLIITEDLLPCAANDAEVSTMLSELARISVSMAHLITAAEIPDVTRDPALLWHTPAEWRALIPNSQPILTAETGTEL